MFEGSTSQPIQSCSAWLSRVEVAFIFLLFFLFGSGLAPEVNEAQYLCKAKHYWDRSWCEGDHFLDSADAHVGFYFAFGWVTRLLDLPTSAWIGRLAAWLLLASGWQRLSYRIVPRFGAGILSAGLWVTLTQRCHLSGEWVIGGVEAKTFAYGFVVWALDAIAGNAWKRVFPLLGIASALHVLVGGWSVVATTCAAALSPKSQRPTLRSIAPGLVLGFLLALPGIVPGLMLVTAASPDVRAEGYQIYVLERLPHHLVFRAFPWQHMARFGAMILVWLSLLLAAAPSESYRRIRRFVWGSLLISGIGVIADLSIADPLIAARVLCYYWYRLADIALPMGVSLGLLAVAWQAVSTPLPGREASSNNRRQISAILQAHGRAIAIWLPFGAAIVVLANLLRTFGQYRLDIPAADRQGNIETTSQLADWQDMCRWAATHSRPDARFLAPPDHQTFKWYAGRSEVVNWKDVPQDVTRIVQWHTRLNTIRTFLHSSVESPPGLIRERLEALAAEYRFQYFVSARSNHLPPLPLPTVWQNASYSVYEMPPIESHSVPNGRRSDEAP
jgi:hypothetical protein